MIKGGESMISAHKKKYIETDTDPMWRWMRKLCVIPREDLFALSQDELHRKYDKLSYKEICELNDKT